MNPLKLALRRLRKSPGSIGVSVASLAIGIGACTAVFSFANAVLLRSLPVPNPRELRVLEWTGLDARPRSITGRFEVVGQRATAESVSPELFQRLRTQAARFADVFGFAPLDDVAVQTPGGTFAANGMIVSENFFQALAVQPFRGRLFVPGATDASLAQQVVLTAEWWERQFAADPTIIGRTVSLNGAQFTVAGVLPRGFPGVRPREPREFYVLLAPGSPLLERAVSVADHWWVRLMARVRPGVSDAALKAALDGAFAPEASSQMKTPEMLVQPGAAGLAYDRNQYRKPITLMFGAVILVMLVACANVAGLSLARGAARRHEMSVRAALGAGRWALVHQSLIESAVITALASGLGVLLATWGAGGIARLLTGPTRAEQGGLSPDLTVLGFTLVCGVVTAVIAGLLPAVQASRTDPVAGLRGRNDTNAPRLRVVRILVIAQIGLSLVLLAGAGLFQQSLSNLRDIRVGFETGRLLTFQTNPAGAGYNDRELATFYQRVQTALAALPGARAASLMVFPLLDNKGSSGGFTFPRRRADGPDDRQTHRLVVGEPFFETLGVQLVAGRGFTAADDLESAKVIVVNQAFVDKYLPDEEPLGQTVATWRAEWRIVGVCGDIRYQSVREPVPPTVYIPFRQFPLRKGAFFAVRTSVPPLQMANQVRKAVAEVDPRVAITRLATQEQLVDATLSPERLAATLGVALGGFALLLSCIGLYGLMAYHVTRRTGEIAIRLAIGARPEGVAGLVLAEALALTAIGIAVGLPGVFVLTRLIQSQLHGVHPGDPSTLAMVTIILVTVALLSAWLPARRASRVDPMVALRSE